MRIKRSRPDGDLLSLIAVETQADAVIGRPQRERTTARQPVDPGCLGYVSIAGHRPVIMQRDVAAESCELLVRLVLKKP